MRRISIALFLAFTAAQALAGDTLIVRSTQHYRKMFTYRLITQEYITNVNGFFLDVKVDTSYLIFRSTGKRFEYKVSYHADDAGKMPARKQDPLWHSEYIIRFDSTSGKAAELVNWKKFRDMLVSDFSVQAAASVISSAEFEEKKNLMNNEAMVRKTVMPDMTYLFSILGDTVRMDAEYMRLKPVRSPMSGKDYLLLGSFTSEVPQGTRNTVLFHARNKAGELEKPELMQEVKDYLYKTMPKDQPIPELTSVGLNSEMDWQYNKAQMNLIKVSLADVLAINNQSRGNIRMFELWDQE